jgi:hypothetical protein
MPYGLEKKNILIYYHRCFALKLVFAFSIKVYRYIVAVQCTEYILSLAWLAVYTYLSSHAQNKACFLTFKNVRLRTPFYRGIAFHRKVSVVTLCTRLVTLSTLAATPSRNGGQRIMSHGTQYARRKEFSYKKT